LGIGADSGHHEHRSPSTGVAIDASGWRPMVRRSIARLVPQPGQNTSSHGVPASDAARIVGDHSMAQRELETAVRAADANGQLKGSDPLPVKAVVTVGGIDLKFEIDGDIELA